VWWWCAALPDPSRFRHKCSRHPGEFRHFYRQRRLRKFVRRDRELLAHVDQHFAQYLRLLRDQQRCGHGGSDGHRRLTIYTSQSACSGVSGAHSFARGSATRVALPAIINRRCANPSPSVLRPLPASCSSDSENRESLVRPELPVLVVMLGLSTGCGSSSGTAAAGTNPTSTK